MTQDYIRSFIEQNRDNLFPNDHFTEIELENMLMSGSDLSDSAVLRTSLQSPATIQLLSIFLGHFGVDRFMMGDASMGLLKLITIGGIHVWWIADIISAKQRCRNYNAELLLKALKNPSKAGSSEGEKASFFKNENAKSAYIIFAIIIAIIFIVSCNECGCACGSCDDGGEKCGVCGGDGRYEGDDCIWCNGDGKTSWNPNW